MTFTIMKHLNPNRDQIVYKLTVLGMPYIGITGQYLDDVIRGLWAETYRSSATKLHCALQRLKTIDQIEVEILSVHATRVDCEVAQVAAIKAHNSMERGWNMVPGGAGPDEYKNTITFIDPVGREHTPSNKTAFCVSRGLPKWQEMVENPESPRNRGWSAWVIS